MNRPNNDITGFILDVIGVRKQNEPSHGYDDRLSYSDALKYAEFVKSEIDEELGTALHKALLALAV